jgi:hypothetical protein
MTNTIAWGNAGESVSADEPFEQIVSYSCIETEEVWPGERNINADPRFVEGGHLDDNGTPDDPRDDVWIEGDYRLLPWSPAIDSGRIAGSPTTDIQGEGRPCGDGVDMGAYEMGDCPGITNPFIRGDANTDTAITIADAIFTLSYVFASGPAPDCLDAADANDDGHIDISDAIYVINFMYRGGPELPAPFPAAGPDPTVDELDCVERGHWVDVAGSVPELVYHTATLLQDSLVLIAGGAQVRFVEWWEEYDFEPYTYLYDPTTNSVSRGPQLASPRRNHTATRLADGRVVIAGGDANDFGNNLLSTEIRELCYSDGTSTGTVLVKAIASGAIPAT